MTVDLAFALLTAAALIGLLRTFWPPPPPLAPPGPGPIARWLAPRLAAWHRLGRRYGLTPRQMVGQSAGLGLLIALVVLALTSLPVLALVCAAVGAATPTLMLSQRRLAERRQQVADLDLAIRSMRHLLEAGAGLEAAIDDVAHHGPRSLRPAFLEASAVTGTGGPRAGVEHLRDNLGADVDGLCDALLVAIETSKRLLPDVLRRIEEQHRQQRELLETTLAMQYRFVLQARTVSLVPLAVLVMMRLAAPNLTRVYETPLGVLLLLALLVAVGVGYWLMLRVGRISLPHEARRSLAGRGAATPTAAG